MTLRGKSYRFSLERFWLWAVSEWDCDVTLWLSFRRCSDSIMWACHVRINIVPQSIISNAVFWQKKKKPRGGGENPHSYSGSCESKEGSIPVCFHLWAAVTNSTFTLVLLFVPAYEDVENADQLQYPVFLFCVDSHVKVNIELRKYTHSYQPL